MKVSRKGSAQSVGSLEIPGVMREKNSRAKSSGTVLPKYRDLRVG